MMTVILIKHDDGYFFLFKLIISYDVCVMLY